MAATADEYDDRRDVNGRIDQQKQTIYKVNEQLAAAVAEAKKSREALDGAQQQLNEAQRKRQEAEAEDNDKAAALVEAEQKLEEARQKVERGRSDVEHKRDEMTGLAIGAFQQHGDLVNLSILLESRSTQDISDRLQFQDQIAKIQEDAFDTLLRVQKELEVTEAAQGKAQQAADEAKKRSEESLRARQAAENQAADQAAKVSALVQANDAAQAKAQSALTAEQERMNVLQAESARVEQSIKDRIAREAAEQLRLAQERRRQEEEAARINGQRPPAQVNVPSGGLVSPIPGAGVTSVYGMRLHPVLNIWALHDGTDLGASCGVPIRAAGAGKVATVYYNNAGYGWRLEIDHGVIGNHVFTTSYNHATHYVVAPGQYVAQGQIIGYVGSTGYSTGCHLHFMVYVDGNLTNPQNWVAL